MNTIPRALPVPNLNYTEFIAADGFNLTTTSILIAILFGKRHDDVLKRIRALISTLPADRLGYFAETVGMRANPSGGADIASVVYVITREGFNLLVMGFTGAKALAFKLAYIDAFNAMAAHIQNQREGLGYRQARHELACADSARRGSLHGRGLNQRRLEIPRLNAEEQVLLELTQPSLQLQ